MRLTSIIFASTAIIAAPTATLAATPGGAPPVHAQPHATTPAPPSSNGGGYNHMNAPAHTTGQPNQSCETTGSPPGNSASAPGSAFNPDGTAGTKYAGEQPQNSRNTASVSQYDVACANQPH